MFSFETKIENGQAFALISRDGSLTIKQDFNHKTGVPFASEDDAIAWASDYCSEAEAREVRALEAKKTEELLARSQIVSAVSQANALLASDPAKYASLASFVDSAVAELSKTQQ